MLQYDTGTVPKRALITISAWNNALWEEFEEVDLDDHEPPMDREYGQLDSGK